MKISDIHVTHSDDPSNPKVVCTFEIDVVTLEEIAIGYNGEIRSGLHESVGQELITKLKEWYWPNA